MKDLVKRIEALEKQVSILENQVCILYKNDDGTYRMHINGKNKTYKTKEEATTDYEKNTGPDSVLIIWG